MQYQSEQRSTLVNVDRSGGTRSREQQCPVRRHDVVALKDLKPIAMPRQQPKQVPRHCMVWHPVETAKQRPREATTMTSADMTEKGHIQDQR